MLNPQDLVESSAWISAAGLPDGGSDAPFPRKLAQALRRAPTEVASLPLLIAARSMAEKDNHLWADPCPGFIGLTEEYFGIDEMGSYVNPGDPVLLTFHGGATFTPERLKDLKPYDLSLVSPEGKAYGTIVLRDGEFDDLLEGLVPTGKVKMFSLEEVANGDVPDPFARYGVFMDFKTAMGTKTGLQSKEEFLKNPLAIARAGTSEYLEDYFDKATQSHSPGVNVMQYFDKYDPSFPQGGFVLLAPRNYGMVSVTLNSVSILNSVYDQFDGVFVFMNRMKSAGLTE